jgi:glycosyltransferase involved in cell wall biosynthesis
MMARVDAPDARLLCLSYHVPYAGVRHAGGAFVHRHLEALAPCFDVTLAVPATEWTVDALAAAPRALDATMIGSTGRPGRLPRGVDRAGRLLAGVSPGRATMSALRGGPQLAALLATADLVEIQWTEMAVAAPLVKRLHPRLPVVCVAHDVVSQALARKAANERGVRATAHALAAARARRVEPRLLSACDLVQVFSAKDATLLRGLGVTSTIEVIEPDLTRPSPPSLRSHEPVVLFVGAMDRRENYEAAEEFVEHAWPEVVARVPRARLLVVGTSPPAGLRRLASATVDITGAVDDLDEWYRRAAVFIAPLRLGAGVKFKVPQAMLYGLPVVATTVAAEGVVEQAGPGAFGAVDDDLGRLADATVTLLTDPVRADAVGETARRWAESAFDFARSSRAIAVRYRELIGAAREPDRAVR